MLYIDKIQTQRIEIMRLIIDPAWHNPIYFFYDISERNVSAANLKEEEDDDDLNNDDEYYNEDEEEKENPFDREPADNEINDDDFPLSTPEDDLIDDDEDIPYN